MIDVAVGAGLLSRRFAWGWRSPPGLEDERSREDDNPYNGIVATSSDPQTGHVVSSAVSVVPQRRHS
ncbi:hypothetical protein [Natronorubrum sulfidifaciens]|uniref:hypothetical protein n=1 Tax=Natronorubrum sulfidifaciens TaxID=388259 RepID=UPI001375AB23|nr:hypothetical protein [Natronorubrum sulfidifaciens]